MVLRNLYTNRGVSNIVFTESLKNMACKVSKRKLHKTPIRRKLSLCSRKHFNDKYMGQTNYNIVINTVFEYYSNLLSQQKYPKH